jgi:hypothetical protein
VANTSSLKLRRGKPVFAQATPWWSPGSGSDRDNNLILISKSEKYGLFSRLEPPFSCRKRVFKQIRCEGRQGEGLKREEKNGSPGPVFAQATPWQASPRMTKKKETGRKEIRHSGPRSGIHAFIPDSITPQGGRTHRSAPTKCKCSLVLFLAPCCRQGGPEGSFRGPALNSNVSEPSNLATSLPHHTRGPGRTETTT